MLEKLRKARLGAGLTQSQMAEKLGLKTAGYRQKEVGDRKISIKEAVKIAEVLNMSLDDIFLNDFQSK